MTLKVEIQNFGPEEITRDIPNLGSFSDYQCSIGLTEGLTDEFKYGNMNYNAENYIPNEISYGGMVLTASYVDVYMGIWESTYEYIRRVNEALSRLNASSLDSVTTKQLSGELHFFRGMYLLTVETDVILGMQNMITAGLVLVGSESSWHNVSGLSQS